MEIAAYCAAVKLLYGADYWCCCVVVRPVGLAWDVTGGVECDDDSVVLAVDALVVVGDVDGYVPCYVL